MEIHSNNPVDSGRFQTIRANPCPYGYARFVLFISLRVAEIGYNRGHGACTGAFESVNPKQQFHKLVVRIQSYCLNDINVLVPDFLQNLDEGVPSENLIVSPFPSSVPKYPQIF